MFVFSVRRSKMCSSAVAITISSMELVRISRRCGRSCMPTSFRVELEGWVMCWSAARAWRCSGMVFAVCAFVPNTHNFAPANTHCAKEEGCAPRCR